MENKNSTSQAIKNFVCSPSGKIVLIIALYALTMLITVPIMEFFEDTPVVILLFAVAFGYFGWKALAKITPDIFLIMPIGGWAIYFLIKGILSCIIGIFVMPYIVAKKITSVIQEKLS